MQRAACFSTSLSDIGSVNSRKCRMRSDAGWYLCTCRSISRKPVTLPIVQSLHVQMAGLPPHPLTS